MSTTAGGQQAITDPTRSKTKRDAFDREFNSRWRDVRGDIRRLLQRGRLDPQNDRPISQQEVDFREQLTESIERHVLEPVAYGKARSGRHWTNRYVTALYTHGITQADRSIGRAARSASIVEQLSAPDVTLLWNADHKERLRQERVEVYTDLEDAVHATVRDATRSYRDAATHSRSRSWILEELLGDDGRISNVGEHRSTSIVSTKGIETINYAAVERYAEAGIEQVGVDPERIVDADVDVEDSETLEATVHLHDDCQHDHSHLYELTADESDPEELDGIRQIWNIVGDDSVCPQCAALAGNVYEVDAIKEGGAPLPVRDTHPGCRCWLEALNPAESGW